jgi:hypothetical protein
MAITHFTHLGVGIDEVKTLIAIRRGRHAVATPQLSSMDEITANHYSCCVVCRTKQHEPSSTQCGRSSESGAHLYRQCLCHQPARILVIDIQCRSLSLIVLALQFPRRISVPVVHQQLTPLVSRFELPRVGTCRRTHSCQ